MWILAVLAGVACLLWMRSGYERSHISVQEYTVRLKKPLKEEKTLVFLSDLHGNWFGEGQKELLDAIRQAKPDVILVGGDMMVTDRKQDRVDLSAALFLLECLAEQYPVYYGYGNHESRMRDGNYQPDFREYKHRLEKMGVRFLSGAEEGFLGEEIRIRGLELEPECYRRGHPGSLRVSDMKERLGEADPGKAEILLAHSPVFFDTYKAWGADLSLSGHFHGGTIWVPGLGGLMTPQFQFFYPYCAGCFEQEGNYLVVSRGMGTHSVNLRLNNPSQLVVIRLQGK